MLSGTPRRRRRRIKKISSGLRQSKREEAVSHLNWDLNVADLWQCKRVSASSWHAEFGESGEERGNWSRKNISKDGKRKIAFISYVFSVCPLHGSAFFECACLYCFLRTCWLPISLNQHILSFFL